MRKQSSMGIAAFLMGVAAVAPGVWADAVSINFDTVMSNAWTKSGVWPVLGPNGLAVVSADFSLLPSVCDINGGFDISQTPITLYPNGILDSDELALISTILANKDFDRTSTGGTCHTDIHNAWIANYAQAYYDLGGGVGGPERLVGENAMIPDIDYLFAGLMTIGDGDSQAFPIMLMNVVVDDSTAQQIIQDPNLHVPAPENYVSMRQYLAWCGDADGDGVSNLHEYEYYYPTGGRTAYLAAALDPTIKPPGSTTERMCDGTGGFLGEYFDDRNLTNIKLHRTDQEVAFNWGNGTPSTLIDADTFSVCWTGYVMANYSEDYTFMVRTDDGVRLWLDDALIINQWNDHGPTTYSSDPQSLEAGHEYLVRMDFYENGGGAVAWLGWQSTSQTKSAIREMYVRPGPGIGDRGKDWIRNPANGHFYRMTDSMTWPQYQTLATTWGGYPVEIADADENTWITQMFGPYCSYFFIGANDSATEGTWVWDHSNINFFTGNYASGAVVGSGYANWASGEPNDAGGEDCGMVYSGGTWNDLSCSSTRQALVESENGHITYEGPTPATRDLWEGQWFALTVTAWHPTGTVSYQWKHEDEAIAGATEATCHLKAGAQSEGNYTCVISDESPASVETGAAYVSVVPASELPVLNGLSVGLLAGLCTLLGGLRLLRRVGIARK